jgi:hypothetical protein
MKTKRIQSFLAFLASAAVIFIGSLWTQAVRSPAGEPADRQAIIAGAQENVREWGVNFGSIYYADRVGEIQPTFDGGYVLAGTYMLFTSAAGCDYWVLKFDALGQPEWQHIYSLSNAGYIKEAQYARSIRQTRDGGFIVAGETNMFRRYGEEGPPSDFDIWILKLTSEGSIEWQRAFGTPINDKARCVDQTRDGGYIIAGSIPDEYEDKRGNCWLIKLSPGGEVEWEKSYQDFFPLTGRCVQQTRDGGYVVAGINAQTGKGSDFGLMKLSAGGDIEWQRSYGGNSNEYPNSVQQTMDGGFILAGDTSIADEPGTRDALVMKISLSGDIEWQRIYTGDGDDILYSIRQTADGGYIAAGKTSSSGTQNDDFWLLKLDPAGGIEWQHAYGGYNHDAAYSADQTADGGYVIAGETMTYAKETDYVGRVTSNLLVLKLNAAGEADSLKEMIRNPQISEEPISYTPALISIVPQNTNAIIQDTTIYPVNSSIRMNFLFNPPLYFSGRKILNRSFSQAEFLHRLTWSPCPPPANSSIITYRIYTVTKRNWFQVEIPGLEPRSLLAELDGSLLEYWYRKINEDVEIEYVLTAVDDRGNESLFAHAKVK